MGNQEYEDEFICPYCGYKDPDWWEHFHRDDEDITTTCDSCGKEFEACKHVSISFSTYKIGVCRTCEDTGLMFDNPDLPCPSCERGKNIRLEKG
jgi:hypothetical protein